MFRFFTKEKIKLTTDSIDNAISFSRLLITLSSGFIGLTFGFFDFIQKNNSLVFYIRVSLICFIVSIFIGLIFEFSFIFKKHILSLRQGISNSSFDNIDILGLNQKIKDLKKIINITTKEEELNILKKDLSKLKYERYTINYSMYSFMTIFLYSFLFFIQIILFFSAISFLIVPFFIF